MKNKTVLLTGAAGFLGSYLTKVLLENNNTVYAPVRPAGGLDPQARMHASLGFWGVEKGSALLGELKVFDGDIAYPGIGIKNKKQKDAVITDVDIVYHSAALARLDLPYEPIAAVNINGTKNLLELCLEIAHSRRLKVNHISTAYVAGKQSKNVFDETMLDVGQGFNNTYEQTKFEAEKLALSYSGKGLDISVFRPSMVMGDSLEGKTNNFKLFYEPMHFFYKKIFDSFPADPHCTQNLINIDTVGRALFELGDVEGGATYHLTSPSGIMIGPFMRSVSEYFGFGMPVFVPIGKFDFASWTPAQKRLGGIFAPYFNSDISFSSSRTQAALKKQGGRAFPEIDGGNLNRIFEYCDKKGYIKKDKAG